MRGAYRRAQVEHQRRAAVIAPHLHRVDAVPARHLARLEQKQNSGRIRAAMRTGLVAEGLAEPAAFGMRLQLEPLDDVVGREGC